MTPPPDPETTERWGRETRLALQNFRISGETMPAEVISALAMIKEAAATVNERHGIVDGVRASAIRSAAEEVVAGVFSDQFPVDVFQTGSGTSTNMNVNEVVAHRATETSGLTVHPNDHVNASQSSNDIFPSAMRIASVILLVDDLLPTLDDLHSALRELAGRHSATVKMARTHLMDAVPMTFGQEVGGWSRAVELAADRLRSSTARLLELPIGGTAVGTGLAAPPGFGRDVAGLIAERIGLPFVEAADHFEAQSVSDAFVELSGMCKVAALSLFKIAGDIRLLGSGPTGGLAELHVPPLQAGSSIMPGKVNPVIPEAVQQVAAQVVGNDATITFASTLSTLQLNTAAPVIARALVSSLRLLGAAASALHRSCIVGLEIDHERMRRYAEASPALVTVLAPTIGYDAAARVVEVALERGCSISEAAASSGVPAEMLRALDDLVGLTAPHVRRAQQ